MQLEWPELAQQVWSAVAKDGLMCLPSMKQHVGLTREILLNVSHLGESEAWAYLPSFWGSLPELELLCLGPAAVSYSGVQPQDHAVACDHVTI